MADRQFQKRTFQEAFPEERDSLPKRGDRVKEESMNTFKEILKVQCHLLDMQISCFKILEKGGEDSSDENVKAISKETDLVEKVNKELDVKDVKFHAGCLSHHGKRLGSLIQQTDENEPDSQPDYRSDGPGTKNPCHSGTSTPSIPDTFTA